MNEKHNMRIATIIAGLGLLGLNACSSSSGKPMNSQAVDGYIVGGSVFCDGEASGVTALAGELTCPKGTTLVTVRGGMDVGFDASLASSDVPFIGELYAPANLGYVTPLSTLAVQLSSSDGDYDSTRWEASVTKLARVLGETDLDLTENAAENMQLVRLNAQIHQVLASFAKSETEYTQSIAAMAQVLSGRDSIGAVVDLEEDVTSTMTAINAALQESYSSLVLPTAELEELALRVQSANRDIAAASSPSVVSERATNSSSDRAVATINRSGKSVSLISNSTYLDQELSIDDFEDDTKVDGLYQTRASRNVFKIAYDNEMLEFDRDLNDVKVTMAFELKSTDVGDSRSLSYVSDDIYLTAVEDQAGSLVINLPENSVFEAVGVNDVGTVTSAEILIDEDSAFSSDSGHFSVDFYDINNKLYDLGFDDILVSGGNYSLTLVISGIQLNERSGNRVFAATSQLVEVGDRQVSGAGFKGYVSYTY